MRVGLPHLVCGLLAGVVALPAFACDLPKLPVIPAKDQLGDQVPAVTSATSAYFEGMRTYVQCLEAALAAAGGDAAPASVKSVLVARNRVAVAEAQAIQKLFQERVGSGQSATPGSAEALRKLVEGLANGTPDYDAMTPAMVRLTRQQLGSLREMTSAGGAIQSIEFVGIDAEGRNAYEVHQESATINARISLDAEGKINGALLQPAPAPGERPPTATIPPRR